MEFSRSDPVLLMSLVLLVAAMDAESAADHECPRVAELTAREIETDDQMTTPPYRLFKCSRIDADHLRVDFIAASPLVKDGEVYYIFDTGKNSFVRRKKWGADVEFYRDNKGWSW